MIKGNGEKTARLGTVTNSSFQNILFKSDWKQDKKLLVRFFVMHNKWLRMSRMTLRAAFVENSRRN